MYFRKTIQTFQSRCRWKRYLDGIGEATRSTSRSGKRDKVTHGKFRRVYSRQIRSSVYPMHQQSFHNEKREIAGKRDDESGGRRETRMCNQILSFSGKAPSEISRELNRNWFLFVTRSCIVVVVSAQPN